ncbi:MAG: hypothetical protein FWC79_07290 [Oscillospiraceae bacterium]|nr:hypothetical protein [Oscillospiraceae bacterium]
MDHTRERNWSNPIPCEARGCNNTNCSYAISHLDEANLSQMATEMGISYIHMDSPSNINSKLQEVQRGVVIDISDDETQGFEDTYFIFVIPLLLLLIYEFINFRRRLIVR